jgi:hypothetical protein
MGPSHVINVVDAAVKHALGQRGTAHSDEGRPLKPVMNLAWRVVA